MQRAITMAEIEVCARKAIENVDSDRRASCVRHVITKVLSGGSRGGPWGPWTPPLSRKKKIF